MLRHPMFYLVIALFSGMLGFFVLDGAAMWIAKVVFFLSVLVFGGLLIYAKKAFTVQ